MLFDFGCFRGVIELALLRHLPELSRLLKRSRHQLGLYSYEPADYEPSVHIGPLVLFAQANALRIQALEDLCRHCEDRPRHQFLIHRLAPREIPGEVTVWSADLIPAGSASGVVLKQVANPGVHQTHTLTRHPPLSARA